MDNFTWHYRDPEISITSRCAYSQPHYKERCVTTRVNSLATLSSTKYSNCNSSIRNSCVFQSSSRAKLLYYCFFYQIRNVYKVFQNTTVTIHCLKLCCFIMQFDTVIGNMRKKPQHGVKRVCKFLKWSVSFSHAPQAHIHACIRSHMRA